jgi:hypothetical protein
MIPPLSHDLPTQHGGEAAAAGSSSHTPLSSLFTTRTYSTAWVPLEGMIQDWLDAGSEVTLATALAAAGHALFALSHEKRALCCYTQGWHDSWRMTHQPAQDALQQTKQHLSASAQHWSHAAHLLDGLAARPQPAMPADELARIVSLSQAAREQQARLCLLAEEVRADLAAAAQQVAGGIATSHSPRLPQQEGMPWPSACKEQINPQHLHLHTRRASVSQTRAHSLA